MTALLLPSRARLLRGIDDALAGIGPQAGGGTAHTIGMVRLTLAHLLAREDAAPLARLVSEADDLLAGAGGTPEEPAGGDYETLVGALTQRFAALGHRVSQGGDEDFAVRAQALERRFYDGLLERREPPSLAPPLTAEGFARWLDGRAPGRYAHVTRFAPIAGGFQKETILVTARRADGADEELVVRAEKPDRFVAMTASAITDEFPIVRAMRGHGVPVAEPLWLEDDAGLLGRRFMVSRRAVGGNIGSAYGDARRLPPALAHSFLETLARIHACPIDDEVRRTALGRWTAHGSLAANTRAEVAQWRHQIWLDPPPPSPAFARLFDWLEANLPQDEPDHGGTPCVLHNDYGPHNILVDGEQVSAVLDWEVARIGDPAGDLSFFLQCLGGAIDREEAIATYERLSGRTISRFRLAWFDVLSLGKVLVSTLSAAAMYAATEPALIDWMQMPLVGHPLYQPQVEARIAAAEAARNT